MTDFAHRICLMRVKSDCHLHFWFLIKSCHQPCPPDLSATTPEIVYPSLSVPQNSWKKCLHSPPTCLLTVYHPSWWSSPYFSAKDTGGGRREGRADDNNIPQRQPQRSTRVEGHPVTLDSIRRTAFSSIISSCPSSCASCGRRHCHCCGWYFDSCWWWWGSSSPPRQSRPLVVRTVHQSTWRN